MIIKYLNIYKTQFGKIFFLACFLNFFSLTGQEKEDIEALIRLDYSVLKDSIRVFQGDSLMFDKYANAYFFKAKKNNDTTQMASGYYYRVIVPKSYKRYDLYDSIIKLTSTSKQKLNYPTIAFYDKAVLDLESYNYSDALSNFINAVKYNKGSNKEYLQFIIDVNIADIKLRIGNNQEGLNLLKKSFRYAVEENFEEENFERYSFCLFNLANAYRKVNYIDSASTYTRLGLKKSKSKSDIHHYFALLKSIIDLEYRYEDEVLVDFDKTIKYFDSLHLNVNSSLGYYYLAKAHLRNNEYEKAIVSFAKVDSLHEKEPAIILPETVDAYKYLIAHYRGKKDYQNELVFLNKYVKYDSVLDSNYAFINKDLKKEYDLPLIIRDKESIIQKLDAKNKAFSYGFFLSTALIFLCVCVVIWQIVQRKKQKIRIKELLEKESIAVTDKIDFAIQKSKVSTNFSEDLIISIEEGLKEFEKNKFYLKKEMNAKVVAESIGTNTTYFTKIFNNLYGTKFNTYLVNKRLDYAFARLKSDRLFRKYTISSIAQESGFGSSESFSKHFNKRFGVYPSSFVKAMESK